MNSALQNSNYLNEQRQSDQEYIEYLKRKEKEQRQNDQEYIEYLKRKEEQRKMDKYLAKKLAERIKLGEI